MDLKGNTVYNVTSGWKLWWIQDSRTPLKGADGDPFEIVLTVLEPAIAFATSKVITLIFSIATILHYLI